MRYWVFAIEGGNGRELGSGWIRARDFREALTLVPHPEVNLYEVPDDSGFPAQASGPVFWEQGAAELAN